MGTDNSGEAIARFDILQLLEMEVVFFGREIIISTIQYERREYDDVL